MVKEPLSKSVLHRYQQTMSNEEQAEFLGNNFTVAVLIEALRIAVEKWDEELKNKGI
jgi:hypothetical protein